MDHLIAPHGGELRRLYLPPEEAAALKAGSIEYPLVTLTARHLCDLELLMEGGFSPLQGFLGQADYEAVLRELRLADGTVWPMPVMLDVSREIAGSLAKGGRLALRDEEGSMLATLTVDMVDHIRQEIGLVGFWRTPAKQEFLRKWLVRYLDGENAKAKELAPFDEQTRVADRLMELAKAKHVQLTQ